MEIVGDQKGSIMVADFQGAWKLRLCVFESWPKFDRSSHMKRFDWSDHVSVGRSEGKTNRAVAPNSGFP